VQVRILALGVQVQFEQCLDGKTCLKVFGDGSDAGLAMRNMNKNQVDCLDGRQMPNFLKSKCNEWLICLKGGGDALCEEWCAGNENALTEKCKSKDCNGCGDCKLAAADATMVTTSQPIVIQFLRTFLHAARVHDKKSGEAKLVQDNRSGQLQNSEQCIDPAEADAEAMDCECMDKLVEKCGGVDEVCFHETFCAQAGVCQAWKDEQCGSSMSSLGQTNNQKADFVERRAVSTSKSNRGNLTSKQGLDDTLTGKCAM